MDRLGQFIAQRKAAKGVALMSHAVLGYPQMESNRLSTRLFAEAGVDLIELQFPYSDPMADGPTLTRANQAAVAAGTTVDACFGLAQEITAASPEARFVIMTYYNVVYARGSLRFVREAQAAGVAGIIVPDLPPGADPEFEAAGRASEVATIFLATPWSTTERLRKIAAASQGMIYCVARKGITGVQTRFGDDFAGYLQRVRAVSDLPIGVGFGLQTAADVAAVAAHADVAIVCSQAIRLIETAGEAAAAQYLKGLRPEISVSS